MYDLAFEELCVQTGVNPVNHGEFEDAASQLTSISNRGDTGLYRCPVLAIQRSRRGGKTFMLHAVAGILRENDVEENIYKVLLISLNSDTKYDHRIEPDARRAILLRIAYCWECSKGFEKNFREFQCGYASNFDFSPIQSWLERNNVIILIDELNVIASESHGYAEMSHMLDGLAGRKGSAVMYSTHHRSAADILRGRDQNGQYQLSTRDHTFLPIPRVRNRTCLNGLQINAPYDPKLWVAVLRGRIPCLILQDQLANYSTISFEREAKARMDLEKVDIYSLAGQDALKEKTLLRRINGLTSALTGRSVVEEDFLRDEFRAYSYMSTQTDGEDFLYAWPPFLLVLPSRDRTPGLAAGNRCENDRDP